MLTIFVKTVLQFTCKAKKRKRKRKCREAKLMEYFIYRLLSQDRSPLPDVPAVYFVEPTSENIKKICEVTDKY